MSPKQASPNTYHVDASIISQVALEERGGGQAVTPALCCAKVSYSLSTRTLLFCSTYRAASDFAPERDGTVSDDVTRAILPRSGGSRFTLFFLFCSRRLAA